ncbi:TPA: peptidase S8/S53 subtilisin kexin sedolisin [Pseudomonas aeruginosa]|nr:peptidase S8/S53 subtilisin kexin sedolisin [Pseudomonas aeruginosa]HEP9173705.1 hypothetical protein [Pseudomonas aeruginosa]
MDITGNGWEMLVVRKSVHHLGNRKRTYGTYQVYLDGHAIVDLAGYICESIGPGNNQESGSGKRIEPGRYPLWTQFGRYRTIGFSSDGIHPGATPMPGILVEGTAKRTGILIHPGHPPTLYLSSVGCLNPSAALTPDQTMEYFDSRARTIALIDSLREFSPKAFEMEVKSRIENAFLIVQGEPRETDLDINALNYGLRTLQFESASLPISERSAKTCTRWLLKHFGDEMRAATKGKLYKIEHLCAIVCQETAYKWLKWVDANIEPKTIIERCVFDASGDSSQSSRSAFPKNTQEFREVYGDRLTDMLIDEANLTRKMQGMLDKRWVYKGYGIFQYDLQHIKKDFDFFEEKQWYNFSICLQKVCSELDDKLKSSNNDLWLAIRKYNGSGRRAEQYALNVKVFTQYCKESIDELTGQS